MQVIIALLAQRSRRIVANLWLLVVVVLITVAAVVWPALCSSGSQGTSEAGILILDISKDISWLKWAKNVHNSRRAAPALAVARRRRRQSREAGVASRPRHSPKLTRGRSQFHTLAHGRTRASGRL